jgi:acetylornithine deacetylase/succinyl-diaminopimelate desuccinylase-like protein
MKQLLKQLVAIPSAYPGEEKIQKFLEKLLQNRGLKVELVSLGGSNQHRKNLLISRQKSSFQGKKILLYGHMDTVNLVGSWQTDPFKLTIKGNRAYGLGSYDMKAGLAIVVNLLTLKEDLPIKAIFSVDEENISTGAHSLKNNSFLKDIAFALVPEPNFGSGENAVCLGRVGRLVVQVYFKGDTNHIFYSKISANAIREAKIFDNFLAKTPFGKNNHFGETIVMPRAFKAEAVGLSVPGEAMVEYDLLTVPPVTVKEILHKFQNLASRLVKAKKIKYLPKIKLKDRLTPYLEPYDLAKNNQWLTLIDRGIRQATGHRAKYYYRHSVADENVLVNVHKIPSFTLGPSGGNAHGANEYVNLESLRKVADIYLAIIHSFMKSLS